MSIEHSTVSDFSGLLLSRENNSRVSENEATSTFAEEAIDIKS